MLGTREPEIYGTQTLEDIEASCIKTAKAHNIVIEFRQSNYEGELIDWIQEVIEEKTDGMIINAAAYTHTSLAIHDALKMLNCPIIEVHLSDPYTREEFRHFSYITPLATKIIKGKGGAGYTEAIEILAKLTK